MQQSRRRYRQTIRRVFVAALLVAAVLRFAGLDFGYGVLTPRADEELLRSGVLISLTGDLNPHYAVWGHLFHYMYLALAAGWTAIQVIAGWAASWTDAVAAGHCQPWTLIWLGRAISATAGVLTLVATYQLAHRSLGSRLSALSSCVLLSTLFLHVRDSHFATSDILLTLFCTAALAAMATRGRLRSGWAGLWTGLALATKLLSATLLLTFLVLAIVLFVGRSRRAGGFGFREFATHGLRFLATAAAVAIVTQPFMLLDPMETWYGLFGDLFNPERRPFEQGLNLTNAKIVVRYYVPQAIGWSVGCLATAGGLLLLRRAGSPRVLPLLVYVFWSLVAILSVQRMFLRYLDPLLPATCVLAAWAIDRAARFVRRRRLALVLTAAAAAAAPNLVRDLWLNHRLLQTDTRALAGRWIEENVPRSREILWSGYGSIESHLTMPWLQAATRHDRQHIAARAARGLPTAVDERIIAWKRDNNPRTYWIIGLAMGQDHDKQSSMTRYGFLEHRFAGSLLKRIDRWSRQRGLLTAESPRWDLMRRHIAETVISPPEDLARAGQGEYIVAVTGMPCDPAIIDRLSVAFEEIKRFEPGMRWTEFGGRVMYDSGDAWYLPNIGIHRVARPGPEIRIFRRRSLEQLPQVVPQTIDRGSEQAEHRQPE